MTLDRSIFRKYDIRGVASDHTGKTVQLTPEVARLVGQALGTYLPRNFHTERVFVGSDNRLTSAPLRQAMIEGLASSGLHVTDIGEVITPTTYFAAASYGDKGAGVQITGSHLTTEYNGIKMAYGKLALADSQIQDLLAIIENGEFATGAGVVDADYTTISRHFETISGKVRMARKLKVVVDAGNGLIGAYIPHYLEQLGLEVIRLYCQPDGRFPNHLPNPEDPEMTVDLERAVVEHHADLGLAFDGDSDRCGFIDNHGHHIAADRLLALLARDLLARHPGASVVFDVKASQALPDEIKKYGGVPVMWKSGHSLMKQKMNEIGSPLGGEVSGHLFMGEDYYGFDDAPLVALRALQIFSHSDQTVAQIFEGIPKLVATPEIILSTPDATKFAIIDDITNALQAQYEVITVDGVRALFEHGWGLVRASNTQPAIALRFEAYTAEQLVSYMHIFKAQLDKHPDIDQTKLDKQIAAFSAS